MICIAGGGTGGHLAIAKALASELKARGKDCIFIGSQNGQDKMWFENSELFSHKYFLKSSGVVDKKGIKKIFSLLNILKLSLYCLKIFAKHKIDIVISVGGYSSAAPSIACILSFKKLFIHEQNAITGRLNLILKPFAKEFFSSYSKNNAYDYPVSHEFFALARQRKELKCVLFLGGSQGASFINSLALKLAPALHKKGIFIIHQCGKNEFSSIKEEYEKLKINAQIFDFSKDIAKFMNKADVCISRCGASSLWELCANTLPCIFIPYPYAAKNHQFYNAKFLADLNLAKVFLQSEVNVNLILQTLENIDINAISAGLKGQINEGASKKIIEKILNFVTK